MRLLIVENSEQRRNNLIKILEEQGVQYLIAEDVSNASHLIRMNLINKIIEDLDDVFDGLILNIRIKDSPNGTEGQTNGYNIIKEIRKMGDDLPTLICSDILAKETGEEESSFVFGYISRSTDEEGIKEFINYIKSVEEKM